MKKLNLITKKDKNLDVININEEDIDIDFIGSFEFPYDLATYLISVREHGSFEGKAFCLNDNRCDYILGKDEGGNTILVAIKK